MKSSAKDDEFIQELIKLHFSIVTSSGNSLEDTISVKKTVVTLCNEFSSQTVGSKAINNSEDDDTLSGCELSGALSEDKILSIFHQLFLSSDIATELNPIISTFLLQLDVIGICFRLKSDLAHRVILQSLQNDLLDDNLQWVCFELKQRNIIDYYEDFFSEGKKEFIKAINCLATSAQASPLNSSLNFSFFESDVDRKTAWEYIRALTKEGLSNLNVSTVQTVLESNSWLNEYIPYFELNFIEFLDQDFVATLRCRESVVGNNAPSSGKEQVLFFSEQGICVVYEKSKIRRRPEPVYFQSADVLQISIGTRNHNLTSGFSSSNTNFLVLTIFTKSHQIHTKNIYLGDSEAKSNTTRPAIIEKLNSIADHYTLVEGDVVQSASGYSIQPSFGVFKPLD
jgi:hypothetical protein